MDNNTKDTILAGIFVALTLSVLLVFKGCLLENKKLDVERERIKLEATKAR